VTNDEALKIINRDYGKGYAVKILEIIERKGLTLIRYKVTADRDGFTEYRVKGWGSAMAGWDYPYRRKWR
jgi:hypothetical protein